MKTYNIAAIYNKDCSKKINKNEIEIDGLKLTRVKEVKLEIREINNLLLIKLIHKEKPYLMGDIKAIEESFYGLKVYCKDFVIEFKEK